MKRPPGPPAERTEGAEAEAKPEEAKTPEVPKELIGEIKQKEGAPAAPAEAEEKKPEEGPKPVMKKKVVKKVVKKKVVRK